MRPVSDPAAICESYKADGFVLIHEPVIKAELVQRAAEGMDEIRRGEFDTGTPMQGGWEPHTDETKLCKMELPQTSNFAIREVVSHAGLGRLATEVTGAERVQVWWTQLLYKPPQVAKLTNTVVGWHQDRSYWGVWEEGSELFTAWVALSDVTSESGPMKFVRGSHRWGFLEGSDFYGQDNEAVRNGIAVPEGESWEEVEAVLPPGGVSFHDRLTIHGSEPNRSKAPRRSLAIHMCTENARIADASHNLIRFLDNTDFNPVIYGE